MKKFRQKIGSKITKHKISIPMGIFVMYIILSFIVPCPSEAETLEEVFLQMRERFNSILGYKCEYESFTTDGKKEETVTYDYFFEKPKIIRMEVKNGKYKGTVLKYNKALDPNRVHVRLGKGVKPLLPRFLIPKSFAVDHKWVVDLGGRGIHQSDWGWYIDYHFEINNKLGDAYKGSCDTGDGFVTCNVVSKNPSKTDGVQREVLRIKKKTLFPDEYHHYDSSGIEIRKSVFRKVNIQYKD